MKIRYVDGAVEGTRAARWSPARGMMIAVNTEEGVQTVPPGGADSGEAVKFDDFVESSAN